MGSKAVVSLTQALSGVKRLGLDANPIVYFIELNPQYDGLVTPIFLSIDTGQRQGVTSSLTLTEVLVYPLSRNDTALAAEYRDLLLNGKNLSTVMLSPEIAERAADLRARYRLKTPDAIQLATAIAEGCEAFLTNDRDLRRVTEISVFVLEDLTL